MRSSVAQPASQGLDAPRRHSVPLRALGRWALGVAGWRVIGDVPHEPRFVVIIAPHTSNWDFVVCLGAILALDIKVRWLGKDELFHWPLGHLFRRLGGWPVRHRTPRGVVHESADDIRSHRQFVIALSPEGTRSRVPRWHTGFYRIAQAAGVPIVPVVLDWSRREIILKHPVWPSGDIRRDTAALMAVYRSRMAKFPDAYWDAAS